MDYKNRDKKSRYKIDSYTLFQFCEKSSQNEKFNTLKF